MLRSSLGFHTVTLSMVLLQPETSQLFDDLKKYKQETGGVKEYPDDYGNWIERELVLFKVQAQIGRAHV